MCGFNSDAIQYSESTVTLKIQCKFSKILTQLLQISLKLYTALYIPALN